MPRAERTANRPGLTLIEVLLVVAILIVIASLASPSLLGMMESQKLRKSADRVRAAFARARLKAMETGRIQMFRYQIGGGGYVIEPWFAADDALEANDMPLGGMPPGGSGLEAPLGAMGMPIGGAMVELPDGVTFVAGETLSDERSLEIDSALAMDLMQDVTWSPPILFYPNGTTSNAVVLLKNKKDQVVELSLRGITGMTQVSDPIRLETFAP